MGTTRERLAGLLAEDPEISAPDAAEILGVSRQRVHQILKSLGVKRGPIRRRIQRTPRPKVLTGGVRVGLTATMKGTVGELLVAADLLQRGYQVFTPITRHTASVDLVILDIGGTSVERIEVKTAKRREGRLIYTAPAHERYDRLAIVATGEEVIYKPAFPED